LAENSKNQLSERDREAFIAICGSDGVLVDEPMSRHTTLKIGGPADAWLTPGSIHGFQEAIRYCQESGIPMTSVGGGSNLLVRDGGIRGVVLSTKRLREIEQLPPHSVRVQAGISTGKLLSLATKWELGGVEFLGGVPGSVGGGWVMNAGTYMGEFKDVTRAVTSVRLDDGGLVTRNAEECGFVYRGSALPKTEVIVEGVLDLNPRPKEDISKDVRALRDRRNEREPKRVSNAGSVFKNPTDDFAGRLLEDVGMKGEAVGGAQCSPVHANWFVNTGTATAGDLLALIDIARKRVQDAHGIELVLEWKIIGDDD